MVTAGGTGEVVLDVGYGDPDSPAVRRLTIESATSVLASRPELEAVRVVSRDGRLLGLVPRAVPATAEVAVPPLLLEPRRHPHAHVPSVSSMAEDRSAGEPIAPPDSEGGRWVRVGAVGLRPHDPVRRSVAEEFDVPDLVREHLRDPYGLLDLVRATLEADGVTVKIDRDTITAGDVAVVLVASPRGSAVPRQALDHAYRRFQASGATTGLVLTLGLMDRGDVLRRELFAPELRHAGPEGIQRMLDGIALGGNPLRFALAPADLPPT